MKRAILYSRVSTPRQAELYSLDYQLEQERSYARDMGFEIVAEFADDMSGRKMDRDGLIEARLMLSEDKADVLVVWKLDRLHRSYVNTVVLRDEIQRMGKELYYAQSKTKSGTRAKERLPEDILALMAEIEADEIAERTQMGKRQKALSGKWIGFNKPPYGYTSLGRGKDTQIVINEAQAKTIRMIFEWYVYGDEKGRPLQTKLIVEKLTALGIPTPQDDRGTPHKNKKLGYGEWGRTAITQILRQSAYMGIYYHFKNKKGLGKNPTTSEHVGIPFPPIVDENVFRLAQEKLTAGRKMSRRNTKYEYLFSRRLWCECGHKMNANTAHQTYTRLDGEVKKYTYGRYQCMGRRKDTVHSCSQKDIRVKKLDDRVWSFIRDEIANPQVLERKLKEIQSNQQDQKAPVIDRLVTLQIHKDTIIDELRRLAVLYSKQSMPEHLLTDLIQQQNQKLKLTEAEILNLQKEVEEPLSEDTIMDLVAFSAEFKARLDTVEQSFEAKRTIVEGLDVRVTVITEDEEQILRISTLLNPDGILRTLDVTS